MAVEKFLFERSFKLESEAVCFSLLSPVSPASSLNLIDLQLPVAKRHLNLETPNFLGEKVVADPRAILKKAREKYDAVIEKYCQLYGVACGLEEDGRNVSFLRSEHLVLALNQAASESCAFLGQLLTIYQTKSQEMSVELLQRQFKTFVSNENDRVLKAHTERQSRFVSAFQNNVWNDFVLTLQARYYFLFMGIPGKPEEQQFYHSETMTRFVSDLIKKYSQVCNHFLNIFEQSGEHKKLAESFGTFLENIEQAGKQIQAKNQRNKEAAENHVKDSLITLQFINPTKSLFSANSILCGSLDTVESLIDKEKKAVVGTVEMFVEQVCLEEKQEFLGVAMPHLEKMTETLIQSVLETVKEKRSKLFDDLQVEIADVIANTSKKYGLFESEMIVLQQSLKQNIDAEKEKILYGGPATTEKNLTETDRAISASFGQSGSSKSAAEVASSPSSRKRSCPPPKIRDKLKTTPSHQNSREAKRVKESSSKPSTSSPKSSSSGKTQTSSSKHHHRNHDKPSNKFVKVEVEKKRENSCKK